MTVLAPPTATYASLDDVGGANVVGDVGDAVRRAVDAGDSLLWSVRVDSGGSPDPGGDPGVVVLYGYGPGSIQVAAGDRLISCDERVMELASLGRGANLPAPKAHKPKADITSEVIDIDKPAPE